MMEIDEQMLELIRHFKAHPVLWDYEHISYYIKETRDEIENNIAKSIKTTVDAVRQNITFLKDNALVQYKRAIQAPTYTGDVTLVSTWPYMKALTFYFPTIERMIKNWTLYQTEILILHYKNKPSLWDSEHINYENQTVKMQMLSNIGSEMNIEPEKISWRLRDLSNRMTKEFNELEETYKDYDGDKGHFCTWRYYFSLIFLTPITKLQKEWEQWSREMTFQLIEYYIGNPLLWQGEYYNYEDFRTAMMIRQNITTQMSITTDEMNKRLHYLISRMSIEITKLEESGRDGSGDMAPTISTWVYYEALTPLIPFIINKFGIFSLR